LSAAAKCEYPTADSKTVCGRAANVEISDRIFPAADARKKFCEFHAAIVLENRRNLAMRNEAMIDGCDARSKSAPAKPSGLSRPLRASHRSIGALLSLDVRKGER